MLSASLSSMSYSNKLSNLRESCKALYLNEGPQKNGWTADLTFNSSQIRAALRPSFMGSPIPLGSGLCQKQIIVHQLGLKQNGGQHFKTIYPKDTCRKVN